MDHDQPSVFQRRRLATASELAQVPWLQLLSEEERAEGELVVMSKKGQVIKLPLKDVPVLGRQTQGVRVMKMREGDSIASVVFV